MADYEPFPTGKDQPEDGRTLGRGLLGCVGCGGAGAAVFLIGLLILAGLATSTSGCDINLGDPGEGKDSKHLAVRTSPTTGLTDGSKVTVASDAFEARSIVGVAVCLREADTQQRGVEACDEIQGVRYAVDGAGHLRATYAVPRLIRVGGVVHDCAEAAERCLLVAADANDYDRSGGTALTFAAGQPEPAQAPPTARPETDRLHIGAQPGGSIPGGTELKVVATGFEPGEPLLVAYCTDAFETDGPAACEPLNSMATLEAVAFRSVPSEGPRASDSGSATVTVTARRTIAPFGDFTSGSTSDTEPNARSDGRIDCRVRPGRCSIVISAAADTKRSAVLPYEIAAG